MKPFKLEAITPESRKWNPSTERESPLVDRSDEIRSKFWRDYNRLLHSNAYRRLKHKTQVFHATHNDHICTRIEHVGHVSAVSYTICDYLGLNKELAQAIAIGHDIGHAPFGHDGESILSTIAKKHYGGLFWHEKNGLHFADDIEMLINSDGYHENLQLTYAVRDGIISHCGEVNEQVLFPREEMIDLRLIKSPNEYSPFTWEGCVVKIADKISYLGRDIEDALQLKILNQEQIEELQMILEPTTTVSLNEINNTVLIHKFILDLCHFSNPKDGIGFSEPFYQALTKIKAFNYKHIYSHPRLDNYNRYAELIINSIFETLYTLYDFDYSILSKNMEAKRALYPDLIDHFQKWLKVYSDIDPNYRSEHKYLNKSIYNISKTTDYQRAIVEFISSLTDYLAVDIYQQIIRF